MTWFRGLPLELQCVAVVLAVFAAAMTWAYIETIWKGRP